MKKDEKSNCNIEIDLLINDLYYSYCYNNKHIFRSPITIIKSHCIFEERIINKTTYKKIGEILKIHRSSVHTLDKRIINNIDKIKKHPYKLNKEINYYKQLLNIFDKDIL